MSRRPRSSAQRLNQLVPTYHGLIVASCSVFCEGELCEAELRILSILEIVLVTMVLIDRASKELSNGGHIVFWSKFGPLL